MRQRRPAWAWVTAAIILAGVAWRAGQPKPRATRDPVSQMQPPAAPAATCRAAEAAPHGPGARLAAKPDPDVPPASDSQRVADTPDPQPPAPVGAGLLPEPATLQTLRDEVAADPHGTPPAVLAFAAAWGAHLQAAGRDVDLAEDLLTWSEARVGEAGGVAPVFQAMCLRYTGLLAQVHPALAPRYQAMLERADTHARQLAQL